MGEGVTLSRLVVVARQVPPLSRSPKQRPHSQSSGERMAWKWQPNDLKMQVMKSEPPSPTRELEMVRQVMLPPGFTGVTACLLRDQSPEKVYNVPQDPLRMTAVLVPTVAAMSTNCIIKDKAMGVTYMDTVTTSVGWVAISGPGQETLTQGPIIENITDHV